MLILQYVCTTWTLTKCEQKKLDEIYKRNLRVVFLTNSGSSTLQNNSCTATYLLSHKPSKLRRKERARHSLWNKDKLISKVLLWTPTHGHTSADRQGKIYIPWLSADNECRREHLPNLFSLLFLIIQLQSSLFSRDVVAGLRPRSNHIWTSFNVQFGNNNLGKGINPLILKAMD